MTPPIIEVEGLGKSYRLGKIGPTRLVDDADRLWQRIRGNEEPGEKGDFWALQDVSFSVEAGEVMGIIGRNGAGKSTLLKLLSRITAPTRGEILLRGRTASLLEIGTGFVGDLSGRENIFLNGAILGMTRREIRSRLDEIVAFAEVEQYIDTPVKRYSSGMYVRLAFAVAAHLEPDILIVDEVLAVGDIHFQRKCLGRLGSASREGRTVLFVSHNMAAVQSLCTRAIMLENGRVVANDAVAPVVGRYLEDARTNRRQPRWDDPDHAPGNDTVRIRGLRIYNPEDPGNDRLGMREEIRVETEFQVLRGDRGHHLAYHVVNDEAIVVFATACPPEAREPGLYRASFTIPGQFLNIGGYSLKLWIAERGRPTYVEDAIASFSVVDESRESRAFYGREPGAVLGRFPWTIDRLGDSERSVDQAASAWSGRTVE